MKNERRVTLRRTIQQVKHCVEEALSVVERDEDIRCALDDLDQAEALLEKCTETARVLSGVRR